MQINPILTSNITPQKLQNNKLNKSFTPQEMSNSNLITPTAEHLKCYNPAFCGGYSLNLAASIKQLDKLAEKYPDLYPPNIREWAQMILDMGNPKNQTLISIHKNLYEGVKNCDTLATLKRKFPEFKDVKSAQEVEYREGTILDDLVQGKYENFGTEEDISLQLIKLYWGDGFSLNDLKAYADGKTLSAIMEKLNIPRYDRNYGHVLKLSDPEYNERLTKEMAIKRQEALDARAQRLENEPVYIKRGPLSPEWRQHISEGLQKFYRENPDRLYEMSVRQKQFYIDNPDQAEILSRVMKKAWSFDGMDGIKKTLSKFLQQAKNKPLSDEELSAPYNFSKEQSKLMKQFWGLNPWAKKRFSKSVERAWKVIKKENETFYQLKGVPTQLQHEFERAIGREEGSLNLTTSFNPYLNISSINEENNKLYSTYSDSIPDLPDIMADTFQMTIFQALDKVQKYAANRKLSPKHKEFIDYMKYTIAKNFNYQTGQYNVQTTREAQQDYLQIIAHAAKDRLDDILEIVYKSLDESYDAAKQFHKEKMSQIQP